MFFLTFLICKLKRDHNFIAKAIEDTINHHKKLVGLCFEIINNKLIESTREFRFVSLSSERISTKISMSYLMLEKLANLFISIFYESKSSNSTTKEIKPMVIAIANQAEKDYFVLGTNGNHEKALKSSLKQR